VLVGAVLTETREGRRVSEGELYFESWGSTTAPALLYLHGGPGQGSYEFVQHQAALLSARLRVVALDQRGVLRSAPLAEGGSLSIADLVADCETVRRQLGVDRWAVLGQSFGGMLALRYATSHPESVTGLLFENPCWDVAATCRSILSAVISHPAAAPHPDARAWAASALATNADAESLWAALLKVLGALGADRDKIYVPDDEVRRRIDDVRAAAGFTAAEWGKGGRHLAQLIQDPDFFAPHTPLLSQWQRPALLIKGGLDPIPSAEEITAFRNAVPGAEIRVFEGNGHFVQAERPHEYADLVMDFVLGCREPR
jgi:proline iminopeptidase